MPRRRSGIATHLQELRRRLKAACLSGKIFFRGNDRSPTGNVSEVGKAVTAVLEEVLPDVYNRFKEASAKKADVTKGIDALLTAENLSGLPHVFTHLELLRDEQNRKVFKTNVVPLSEVLARIDERAAFGEQATGKFLEDEFLKAPFGWDFDVMRLLTLASASCRLHRGRIQGPGDRAGDEHRRQANASRATTCSGPPVSGPRRE